MLVLNTFDISEVFGPGEFPISIKSVFVRKKKPKKKPALFEKHFIRAPSPPIPSLKKCGIRRNLLF
jgi:hypothetical protein